jgi:hypothetical protein
MQQAQAAAGANTPAKLAVYEVNLSTASGGTAKRFNHVAVGLGAGIAAADHMLLMSCADSRLAGHGTSSAVTWASSGATLERARHTI